MLSILSLATSANAPAARLALEAVLAPVRREGRDVHVARRVALARDFFCCVRLHVRLGRKYLAHAVRAGAEKIEAMGNTQIGRRALESHRTIAGYLMTRGAGLIGPRDATADMLALRATVLL